jgi:LacI family transcriptional regulator
MKKIVRIKDIAVKAKVSPGTVDRVIHNRGRVSEEVRTRVMKIIKDMNYEPNLMARTLGVNKRYHFAALIPDHKEDPYWLGPKTGIEKAAKDLKQYGVTVEELVFNANEVNSYVGKAKELTRSKPDGILLSPIFYRETLPFFEKWKQLKIPFVLFNTQIAEHDPLSYIGQDSYQSGLLAGKLIHYGYQDRCSILIAHIDEETKNAAHLVKKEQGVRNYFKEKNLEHQYNIFSVELNRSNSSAFIKKLGEIIENTVDLRYIFVTTSQAYEIASYLEQRHLKHIRLLGYDLLPKNLYYLNKDVISFLINQNPKGQGYWGIHQLANHIVFKKEVPLLKYLPLDIVTRENLNYYIDENDPAFVKI